MTLLRRFFAFSASASASFLLRLVVPVLVLFVELALVLERLLRLMLESDEVHPVSESSSSRSCVDDLYEIKLTSPSYCRCGDRGGVSAAAALFSCRFDEAFLPLPC
jgi:hypothetical protein